MLPILFTMVKTRLSMNFLLPFFICLRYDNQDTITKILNLGGETSEIFICTTGKCSRWMICGLGVVNKTHILDDILLQGQKKDILCIHAGDATLNYISVICVTREYIFTGNIWYPVFPQKTQIGAMANSFLTFPRIGFHLSIPRVQELVYTSAIAVYFVSWLGKQQMLSWLPCPGKVA